MTNKKKGNAVIAAILVSAIVSVVFWLSIGDNNQPDLDTLIEKVQKKGTETGLFGGGSRYPNGLSADSTAPSAGQIRGTTLTITSTADIGSRLSTDELLTQGGGWFATSTTGTLTETQMLANNGIYITATGAGQAVLALTLPATSTMTTLLATAGDCAQWFIDASDVAAGTTTTITAGTGWNLVGLDATGAGTGADVIDGAEYGKLTACRETDTDVVGYVEEWIAAD